MNRHEVTVSTRTMWLRCSALVALLGALVLPAALLAPAPARAGARDVEVLFVRLDDGSDAAATSCAGAVRGALSRAVSGEIHLMTIPRDVLQTRLGVTSLDGLVAWPRERFSGALSGRPAAGLDALVMLDCQPALQRLDLVVFAGTGALPTAEAQRLSVRHTEITPAVARFAGSVAGVWQTEGFSP
jgi:hypothetical protein